MKKNSFMRFVLICTGLFIISFASSAQEKYFTRSGKIQFFSKTKAENIDATSRSAAVVLDSKTGDLQFAVLMKGFEFKKALMQEHFNKEYIESDKFPKAEFKGQITNNADIKYTTDGTYPAKVKGKLTIHGETKDIETTGIITVKSGKIITTSTFNIQLPDYKIKVPSVTRSQISDDIKITIDCSLEVLKQ
ncbi:MAG: YceI family protein [Bacteroidetes bacterium]|nr:MAG: YceI family protein [Bacteroidota bacterium]